MHCSGCSCPRGTGPTQPDQQGGSASTPADVSVEHVDHEIQRLSLAIKALHHRRNALVPVSRLIPDVLCRIFEFLTPTWDEPPSNLSWMSFSCVSRRWRDIALAHPLLWTCIPTTARPDVIQEFLRRSQAAPLWLEVPYPEGKDWDEDSDEHSDEHSDEDLSDSIRGAFRELGRTDSLRYTVCWDQDVELLNSYHSAQAPILERVKINCWCSGIVLALRWMSPRCTPRLRELAVTGLTLSWPLALPSVLTRLHLGHDRADVGRPSAVQLRNTLENLSNLEHLRLCWVLPNEQPLAPGKNVGAPISLQKLANLDIVDHGAFCAAFVQKVALPDLCFVSLSCDSGDLVDDVAAGILFNTATERYRLCREHRRHLGLFSCMQVTRYVSRWTVLRVQELWVSEDLQQLGRPISDTDGARMRWGLTLRMKPEALFAYWEQTLGDFVREDVQRLEMTGPSRWDEKITPVPVRGVDTIYSDRLNSEALLRSLYRSKVPKNSPVVDYFPVLRTLILSEARLNDSNSAQLLLDTLREGSSGIRKVLLQSCRGVLPELFEIPDVEVVHEI